MLADIKTTKKGNTVTISAEDWELVKKAFEKQEAESKELKKKINTYNAHFGKGMVK